MAKKEIDPQVAGYTTIGEYTLCNEEKYKRVEDVEHGGFGKNPTDEQRLAFYDKFGGLILDKNAQKVPTHTFWNAYKEKHNKIKEEPKEEPKEESEKTQDLAKLKKSELIALAGEKEIELEGNEKKADLIELLS